MPKFAGIELDSLRIKYLSDDQLQSICTAFIENYKASGASPVGFGLPEQVLKHLQNFAKLQTTPVRTAMQAMAMAIRFFPDAAQEADPTRDDDILQIVREALQEDICRGASLDELYLIITKNKTKLDFMMDWNETVEEVSDAVIRSNFSMASKGLNQIKALSKNEPQIIALQIVYYITIKQYIEQHLNLEHSQLLNFHSKIEKEIITGLLSLDAVLLNQELRKSCSPLRGIFFCKGTKANNLSDASAESTKLRANF